MKNSNELLDKVIDFCEALKNFQCSSQIKPIIDAIINSDKFKQMKDCAFDEKIFNIKNGNIV